MRIQKLPLADATTDQLLGFAASNLGIFLPKHTKVETVMSKITQAWENDYILVMVEDDGLGPMAGKDGPNEGPTEPSPAPVQPAPAQAPEPVGVAAPAQPIRRSMKPESSKMDPNVLLTIHEAPGKGGKRAVPVSVNGSTMLIERGKQSEVPWRFFLALENAVQELFEEDDENEELVGRDVPSYPYTVHRTPSGEEIDAWNKRDQERANVEAMMQSEADERHHQTIAARH